jgi:hypothetical protein
MSLLVIPPNCVVGVSGNGKRPLSPAKVHALHEDRDPTPGREASDRLIHEFFRPRLSVQDRVSISAAVPRGDEKIDHRSHVRGRTIAQFRATATEPTKKHIQEWIDAGTEAPTVLAENEYALCGLTPTAFM